jgi:hypothetical protein
MEFYSYQKMIHTHVCLTEMERCPHTLLYEKENVTKLVDIHI